MLHGPLIGPLMVSSRSLMGASWPLLVSWSLHGSLWSLMGSLMASHDSPWFPPWPLIVPSWLLVVLVVLHGLSQSPHVSFTVPSSSPCGTSWNHHGPSCPLTVPSRLPLRPLISTSWLPCGPSWPLMDPQGPSWPLTDPSWSLMVPSWPSRSPQSYAGSGCTQPPVSPSAHWVRWNQGLGAMAGCVLQTCPDLDGLQVPERG